MCCVVQVVVVIIDDDLATTAITMIYIVFALMKSTAVPFEMCKFEILFFFLLLCTRLTLKIAPNRNCWLSVVVAIVALARPNRQNRCWNIKWKGKHVGCEKKN